MSAPRSLPRSHAAADVLEGLPIGIITFRYDKPDVLTLVEANAAARAVVGGGSADWVGLRFEELWPPRMVEKVKPALLSVAETGVPYEDEVAIRGDAEIRRAFRMRGFSIGERRIVITFEDVTEQRQAEESLARSEARFRGLVEDLSDVVFATDASGALTYVSPAVLAVLGYRPDEMVGRSYRDFAPPGTLPPVSELAAYLVAGTPSAPIDYPVLTKDGRTMWARVSAHIVRGERGEAVGIQGVFCDVTAPRLAREALDKTRRDMELVLNATSDFLTYYAPDLTVRWMNKAAASATGRPESEIVGKRCHDVWTCALQGGAECAVQRAVAARCPCESRVRTQDGRAYVVRTYPAFDGDRLVGVVESTVDITASVREREERERMEAQLRQSQKLESIGTLASGIAHEVNNPLTGMINYAELIATRVEDDRLREYAVGIQEEGARVAAIVRNLLSFARKDSGETVAVPPANVVETTLMLVRALLERDGIDVRIDMPVDLPRMACRAQQTEQVLLNLLTNARDALDERFAGTASAEKWLAVRGRAVERAGAAFVRLTVEDNGTGIPEAIRERVLDPFFTTKPRDRGTGLGLSVSYGIVRDHGGLLWIESPAASGGATAVHVELPTAGRLEEGDRR